MSRRTASLLTAVLTVGLLVAPIYGRQKDQKDQKDKSANPPQAEKQKPAERRGSAPCDNSPISGDRNEFPSMLQETLSQVPDAREFETVRREMEDVREQLQQTSFTLSGDLNAVLAEHSVALQALDRSRDELAPLAQEEMDEEVSVDDEDGNVVIELNGDHGWLGVTLAEVTADKSKELKLPAERGALVQAVEEDSPAAKAGLKAGDVITTLQGQQIEGTAQFRRLVGEIPPGRTVTLVVWRDGAAQTLTAQLAGRHSRISMSGHHRGDHASAWQGSLPRVRAFPPIPPIPPMEGEFYFRGMPGWDFQGPFTPRIGVDAEDVSGQLAAYFGIPDGEGILIRDVRPGSPAEKAGIKAGDVITSVGGARVKTVSDLRARLREKAQTQSEPNNKDKQEAIKLTVGILRKGAAQNLNVEIAPVKRSDLPRKVRRVEV
jgi:C-terminal processing protease CtpA/Prc